MDSNYKFKTKSKLKSPLLIAIAGTLTHWFLNEALKLMQHTHGYVATIVSGKITYQNGKSTDERPGSCYFFQKWF